MLKKLIIIFYFLMSFNNFAMDVKINNIMTAILDNDEEKQITQCVNLLKDVLGECLLGIYLYGSAIVGGLQKYSDIDIFVVLDRATTSKEKIELVTRLLKISGIYMKSPTRPIEMTLVVKSEVNPWHYPPHFDFQYGEWLRNEYEQGNFEPWTTKEMPDLALLVTQVLLANKILFGPEANKLLSNVPYKDFMLATLESLGNLVKDIKNDTHNVLLTLARIWNTVETNTILSKSNAAAWAIDRLPSEYKAVMERAKAVCVGESNEYWDDIEALIEPCANFIVIQINKKISLIEHSDKTTQFIKLGK